MSEEDRPDRGPLEQFLDDAALVREVMLDIMVETAAVGPDTPDVVAAAQVLLNASGAIRDTHEALAETAHRRAFEQRMYEDARREAARPVVGGSMIMVPVPGGGIVQ